MNEIAWPKTLIEAVQYFSDPNRCLTLLSQLRWPGGVVCPYCGSKKATFLKTRHLWKCKNNHAKRQFSIKIGSIFEDSPLPLHKWLVAMWLITNRKRRTLQDEVRANVAAGSEVFTDELASYTGLEKDYVHQFVNHAEKYVEGNVHTNGIENFWSLLKRGLKGTYVSVEPFHLFRYLYEPAFRYNQRHH